MPFVQCDKLARTKPRTGRPLYAGDFVPMARNGIRDPGNAYCHAMQWYRGCLYVGVTRHTLCGTSPYDRGKEFEVWPVQVPDIPWEVDWRAQIWRFDPRTGRCENVRVSPMAIGERGVKVPRQIGYREMRVFQGQSDPEPALYTVTWGSHMGPGPHVLRCADGTNFEETVFEDEALFGRKTLRPLAVFNDQLFTATAGLVGGKDADQRGGQVLCSRDPGAGQWRLASEINFGDDNNITVFELEPFNGFLYAGTLNPYDGMQLWKTDAEGKPPYRWKKILSRGAGRGKLNELVCSMRAFNGALYIGTAIYNCGYDRIYNVGPGRPEVIRVYPDDTWDLVVGEPRLTDEGLRAPTSGLGPGFNNPFCGYVWRLCEHDGWLYAGTCVWSTWLPFTNRRGWSAEARRVFTPEFEDRLLEQNGGFDLWRSRDGDRWEPVTLNGFNNRFNSGVRTMVSTPVGLFVGVVNQFGSKVAVRRAAGWRYETNDRGGVELWLGTHDPLPAPVEIRPLETLPPRPEPERAYVVRTGSDVDALFDEFYDYAGWRHIGFWKTYIPDARRACENLIEEVLAFTKPDVTLQAPVHPADEVLEAWVKADVDRPWEQCPAVVDPPLGRERVLDVGCRLGATLRYLRKHFAPEDMLGVGSDREELRLCRQHSPGQRFEHHPLPRLKLTGNRFDKVLCVEGPGEFGDRRTLLREIHRVLRPGGQLVGADLIGRGQEDDEGLASDACRRLLERLGFEQVRVVDVTDACLVTFREKFLEFLWAKRVDGEADEATIDEAKRQMPGGRDVPLRYCLISAVKPDSAAKTNSSA